MFDEAAMYEADERFLMILKTIIPEAYKRAETDKVSRALLFLLVRVGNTWRSIRTLRQHTPDREGFMVDAATLLRAMFDACFQAEFIFSDPAKREECAQLYLEFEHVERYESKEKVLSHSNPFADRLRASPKRTPEAEKRVLDEYNRVKPLYFNGKKHPRKTWYKGTLRDVAEGLGTVDEYDTFVATYQGSVHSSALAIRKGPLVKPEDVLTMATYIAARVAKVNLDYGQLPIEDGDRGILESVCKSILDI